MTDLNQFLLFNMLEVWGVIGIMSLVVASIISDRAPKGWVWTVILAVTIIPITVFMGTLISFMLVMYFTGMRVIITSINDPVGSVAYFLETGLEYSVIVIPFSISLILFLRLRKGKRSL